MRYTLFTLLAVFALCVATGCTQTRNYAGTCAAAPETCQGCGPAAGPYGPGCAADPGPAVGAVAYPYYTLHGPRDFLARCPRSIGP